MRQWNPAPQPWSPVEPLQSNGWTVAGVPGFMGTIGWYGVCAACAEGAKANAKVAAEMATSFIRIGCPLFVCQWVWSCYDGGAFPEGAIRGYAGRVQSAVTFAARHEGARCNAETATAAGQVSRLTSDSEKTSSCNT
ncbi:hypothetical protein [Mycobacterium saskatchewanense]|uniref:hypothetical protein n=1 Tax=Mycobacterium saskatchewanense TaxID=220927 RepID=UPI00130213E0|nr:hypothetical protein [Mycobacterium saskatchewanense]